MAMRKYDEAQAVTNRISFWNSAPIVDVKNFRWAQNKRAIYTKHQNSVGRHKICRTTKIEELQFLSSDKICVSCA
jgi:hypothetical protein